MTSFESTITNAVSTTRTSTLQSTISTFQTTTIKHPRRSSKYRQNQQRYTIISNRKAPPCCVAGTKAGSWGYLCMAHERFVTERFFLPHPLKVKFTRRRSYVQLDLARKIQRCSRHPVTAKLYEKCCDKAQHRLYQRMGLES